MPRLQSRRAFLRLCLVAPLPIVLGACSQGQAALPPASPVPPTAEPASPAGAPATVVPSAAAPATAAPQTEAPAAAAATLPPTPACDDGDEATITQTEGPYYTPSSPERVALVEPDMRGTRLVLTGQVVSTACAPLAGALVDIWQCDDAGVYDNEGFRLRGHQFTDAAGAYRFETILPGRYPGRTRHIHVKVQPRGGAVLTTQLYFPDEQENARDRIFDPSLLVALSDASDGKAAAFTFVLAG